jgi:hypothetical protein
MISVWMTSNRPPNNAGLMVNGKWQVAKQMDSLMTMRPHRTIESTCVLTPLSSILLAADLDTAQTEFYKQIRSSEGVKIFDLLNF